MSSKRQIRRRQCVGKIAHRNEDDAWAARRRLGARGQTMMPYKCPWCGEWHLGHPNHRVRQSMRGRG